MMDRTPGLSNVCNDGSSANLNYQIWAEVLMNNLGLDEGISCQQESV